MSSNPLNNKPVLRTTGDGSLFRNRVKQAATKKVADATQQRSVTIGNANEAAAAKLAEAHQTASQVFLPKAEAAYLLTDQGVSRCDMQGQCEAPLPLGLASNFVIDLAAQRIYWSELVGTVGSKSVSPLPTTEVTFYPEPSFQGNANSFSVNAAPPDPGYVKWIPFPLNFLPPQFQLGSLKRTLNHVVTVFEKPDATGRVCMFTQDETEVVNDWPIDSSTSAVVSVSYHCLMSARLDGSDRTQIAALPEFAPGINYSGAVALDSGRGLLFWFTPSGQIMKVDFAGGPPVVITSLPDILAGMVGLGIDPTHQLLYWSKPEMFGVYAYGGALPPGMNYSGMLVMNARQHVEARVGFNLPSDWFSFNQPPVMIAVDGANNRMFCCDGQQIWRAGLNGWPLPGEGTSDQRNPNNFQMPGLYTSYASAWGLVHDPATQMLYWLAQVPKELGSNSMDIDLMQMNVDPSVSLQDSWLSVKKIFTFSGVNGHGNHLAMFGSADIADANRLVNDAHQHHQEAQTQANTTIDNAHQAATTRRQKAQDTMNQNQLTAAANIANANQLAATQRQEAQSDAQKKRDQAAQNLADANADADRNRAEANRKAQDSISQSQTDADNKRSEAQAKLDAERQKLQNT